MNTHPSFEAVIEFPRRMGLVAFTDSNEAIHFTRGAVRLESLLAADTTLPGDRLTFVLLDDGMRGRLGVAADQVQAWTAHPNGPQLFGEAVQVVKHEMCGALAEVRVVPEDVRVAVKEAYCWPRKDIDLFAWRVDGPSAGKSDNVEGAGMRSDKGSHSSKARAGAKNRTSA